MSHFCHAIKFYNEAVEHEEGDEAINLFVYETIELPWIGGDWLGNFLNWDFRASHFVVIRQLNFIKYFFCNDRSIIIDILID